MHSSLLIGRYFLFLLSAGDHHPLKIQFRDRKERGVRSSETSWKEKIYLYPAILGRKWLEYRFQDRFIPAVRFDNILPLHAAGGLFNPVHERAEIVLSSPDKTYPGLELQLLDAYGDAVVTKTVEKTGGKRTRTVSVSAPRPGEYLLAYRFEGRIFVMNRLLFYRRTITHEDDRATGHQHEPAGRGALYCGCCGARLTHTEPGTVPAYVYRNYIPIKEFLDLENHGFQRVLDYLASLQHPPAFRSGLVHLLNMVRSASLEDETAIMTNLFRDDPAFAHYITDRLFLFGMIPLIPDRELQNLLCGLDDRVIGSALSGQDRSLTQKVLSNVSARRAGSIREEKNFPQEKKAGAAAREEVNRHIRTYFEQRFGRVLRIPGQEQHVYLGREPEQGCPVSPILDHRGPLFHFDGTDLYGPVSGRKMRPRMKGSTCLPCDVESEISGPSPAAGSGRWNVSGVTEEAVFITSSAAVPFVRVHLYDWASSLEDVFTFEALPPGTTLPIWRRSSSLILTIGWLDELRNPREQIIRLHTRSAPR
jgi:hypothetical protein